MKRIFNSISIVVLAVAFISITSCKKKDDSLKCVISRLITETSGVFDTSTFTYNNDKKVIGVLNGPNHVLYNYFGNSVHRFSTSGLLTTRDSLVYSSSGKLKEIYSFNSSGDLTQRGIYSYDSQDILFQLTQTSYPSLSVAFNNVTYVNGDPVTISDGVNTTTLTFDVNKSAATGDYLNIFQFLNFGGHYLFPKHLITSINSGSSTSTFMYDFDANGNVSKLTLVSGASTSIYHLSYLCD